ncbi:MAG: peptidoglycan DD-metalloendopeptidase family protein [Cyclobacteriaceae bacterium]
MIVSRVHIVISLLCLFTCILSQPAYSQKSRSQLEKEKKDNLARIKESEQILNQTEQKKKTSLGQLRALNQQIKARTALIESISDEVSYLSSDITDLGIVANALESDLEKLKQEYAQMIYASYKSSWGLNKLTYLFSSSTFNQLTRRMKYLEQYAAARKTQAQEIELVSLELKRQREEVISKKEQQDQLLQTQIAENEKLLKLKGKQSGLVTELSKKEKQLKKELNDRKAAINKLNDLIATEIKLEASKKNSATAKVDISKLSKTFEKNRYKMPWPVDKGFISMKYGKHPHPVLKGEYEYNKGVIIQTQKDEKVKAVFDGKVRVVQKGIPLYKNMLIIKHGEYFTLYAFLDEVNVEVGQTVSTQDIIGEVLTNKEGVSQLQFEVWKNTTNLNPEKWLKNR